MISLINRILKETRKYHHSESPLLGWCNNYVASINLSRYLFASKFVKGVVLDCASGACYGSSILGRSETVTLVVGVDINKDLLKYGRIVYDVSCVCADAEILPFRKESFDSIVSLETLEHLMNGERFIENIKTLLRKKGTFILSTPNKFITSPFLKKPLNPYHVKEYYLGQLVNMLKANNLYIKSIYGGIKVKSRLEIARRVIGYLLKSLLSTLSSEVPNILDEIYHYISKQGLKKELIDPVPHLFRHERLKKLSNYSPFSYFFIICKKLG